MKKKGIIIIVIVLLLLALLFVLLRPNEVMQSDDGGSTTIYKSLISETISYDRPPIGSKTYKKGKIIRVLGHEVYNNVVVLDNPDYLKTITVTEMEDN